MKKLILIASATLLLFSLSACDSKEESSTTIDQQTQSEMAKETSSVNDDTDNVKQRTLVDLEEYMLTHNVFKGNKTKMSAEMLGAIDGFKYADCNTEIYEYDVNSTQYKTLSAGEAIELQGMPGITAKAVSINGNFVLFGNPSQEIIDCFRSFK